MELKRTEKHIWKLKDTPAEQSVRLLGKDAGISPLVATLLLQRGIDSKDAALKFLRPALSELHDPFLMKDMDQAVNVLSDLIASGKPILVYGDYDVDGTTAVSMMSLFLEVLGVDVLRYLPDRYKEGYGVSMEGIAFAIEHNCGLIITLDCGISAVETLAKAKEAGIKVIVCDHHMPGSVLPPADAVLDPMREDCSYPFKGLSGCGVGFKLIQAFCMQQGLDEGMAFSFIDLLTVSIAADIVSMTGENRILAHFGLKSLNSGKLRPGISALLQRAGVKNSRLGIEEVVFVIAPRINAAGRMAHGSLAVELMRTTDAERAFELAGEIEELNKKRREQDMLITAGALEQLEGSDGDAASVVYQSDWHKGVIGIVASRLIETYFRPTIVLTGQDGLLTGSGRSVPGFNLHQGLTECADLLTKFGGHPMAAGMSLKQEALPAFQEKFKAIVSRESEDMPDRPLLEIDAIIDLAEFSSGDYAEMRKLAPFGPDNMMPVFLHRSAQVAIAGRRIGGGGAHMNFSIRTGSGITISCVAFQMGQRADELTEGAQVDLAFTFNENHWNGKVTLQLQIRDFCLSEAV